MITVLHLLNKAGKPYRKTLQFGFCLQAAVDWRMGQVLNGLDPDKRSDRRMEDSVSDMYACAFLPPNYPMPARLITFEYWPAHQTDSGKPAVYGHDHHKPGRWLEFLEVSGEPLFP